MTIKKHLDLENGTISPQFKQAVAIVGLLFTLPGLPALFGFFCIAFILTIDGDPEAITVGLISFTMLSITIGAGGTIFWHSLRSLQGRGSQPLRFLSAWQFAGLFGLLIILGVIILYNEIATGLFFPPVFLGAAGLPALFAIAWFASADKNNITWRQGLIAFAGGTTVSVLLALILETLFPTIILALIANLSVIVFDGLEAFFDVLAGQAAVSALTSQGFIYLFLQLTLIAPFIEELVKPIIILPFIGRLSRRNTFLIGALVGGGFATLENVLYAGFGFSIWAGILIIRALGGVIHPFGTGLTALGWRAVLKKEPNAWASWLARFILAVGMHAIWNGGSLLIITLGRVSIFGTAFPKLNLLGISATSFTLALLLVLSMATLWLGRRIVQNDGDIFLFSREPTQSGFTFSDRTMAIWALSCFAIIVPMGLAVLQLLI